MRIQKKKWKKRIIKCTIHESKTHFLFSRKSFLRIRFLWLAPATNSEFDPYSGHGSSSLSDPIHPDFWPTHLQDFNPVKHLSTHSFWQNQSTKISPFSLAAKSCFLLEKYKLVTHIFRRLIRSLASNPLSWRILSLLFSSFMFVLESIKNISSWPIPFVDH